MAFILKSTKFIHGLIECSIQRTVTTKGRKNVFFSMVSRTPVIQKVTVRTAASLPAQEQNSALDLEESFYRLNGQIRNKRVFLESVREVFDIVKQRGEITDPQLMLLLKCCSEVSFMSSSQERIQFAEEIWKATADFGIELNINHYNGLLSVFLENNHKFSPSEFLSALEEKGIQPNLVTHRRILKAFCQMGDIKGASSMLEKMKELNFPLSEEDFNALIQCHCKIGEFQKANEILKVMQGRGVEPTEKTYVNLLCGYAKHGEIKTMMDLLEKLPEYESYLSCSDFLEIIYTLAVNDHTEHIDKIVEKLTNDYERIKSANLIIQRLLHQKMDSIALELFEKLEEKEKQSEYIFSRSNLILRHFALYREPKQILDICEKLEEKGLAKGALGFVLKVIFHHKDENFCLKFLQTMMRRNIRVRSHYFWPLLIKASEKGNTEMLRILNIMPPPLLATCLYTTTKIVFPNYKFSDNWEADNEVLQKAGLPQNWLSACFIEKLTLEGKLVEVERLVSLFPLDVVRYNSVLNNLIDYVQDHPEEVERFVNILYCLAHDFKLRYEGDSQVEDEVFPETSSKNVFDISVAVFVKLLRDEKVFEQVLQKMLERKFGISSEGASMISESPNASKLSDLAKKLSDPGLQVVYDDNLLKLKQQNPNPSGGNYRFKRFKADDEINIEELQEELAEGSFFKALYTVRNMIRIQRYADALSLAKVLGENKEGMTDMSRKRLYRIIINELYSVKQDDWAEKAFYLGVDMGILSPNDYVLCVANLFDRGESSLAVEKYCSHLEKTKQYSKTLEFLILVVSKGNEDDLRRVIPPMIKLIGKNSFMTFLVVAFAESGNFAKAKELLETKSFKLVESNLYYHCNLKAKWGTSKELENLLKLVKDTEYLDRVPLYKLLIKKYAMEKNITKIKQLWLLIEEDDISDYSFLEKMRELMDNPSVEGLKDIASTFEENLEVKKRELKSDSLLKEKQL